jgi:hypothetical protein
MEPGLVLTLSVSYAVALVLLVRLWREQDYLFFKIVYTLFLAVPVLGVLLYLFAGDRTPPQPRYLQNTPEVGGFGRYTHRWISIRNIFRRPPADPDDQH